MEEFVIYNSLPIINKKNMGGFFSSGSPEFSGSYKDVSLAKTDHDVRLGGGFLSGIPGFGIAFNDYALTKTNGDITFGRNIEPKGANSKANRKNNLQIYTD